MISFSDLTKELNERFINLVGEKSQDQRRQYAETVWKMLQAAYAPIGGIHGSGFGSIEDMIANLPFWKLSRRDGKIVCAAFYKDSSGRKRVAVATDGSEEGKKQLAAIMRDDYSRAYFEISSKSLIFNVRNLGYDFILAYAKHPGVVAKITGDEIAPALDDDPEVKAHPQLRKFFYQRKIGGAWHTKIMLGTNGKKIVVQQTDPALPRWSLLPEVEGTEGRCPRARRRLIHD